MPPPPKKKGTKRKAAEDVNPRARKKAKPTRRCYQSSGLNYMVMPDQDGKQNYSRHVNLRVRQFCLLVHSVAHLCRVFQPNGQYKTFLSDKATVQVDLGVHVNVPTKIDAAHLCNTSFESQAFLNAVAVQPPYIKLEEYCNKLRTISAATTPQSKYDNIGPDKVIDNVQTNFKNDLLKAVQDSGNIPEYRDIYNNFLQKLNIEFSRTKAGSFNNPKSRGYDGATAALNTVAHLTWDSSLLNLDWALEYEFKYAEEYIDELFTASQV